MTKDVIRHNPLILCQHYRATVREKRLSVRKLQGFSLIELLVVLAVAAILINVAAPSFASALLNARVAVSTNLLTQSIHYGRSEAVKRLQPVSICARATDVSCNTNNDWSSGWLVYTDASSVGTPGTLDAADTVLRVVKLRASNMDISADAVIGTNASAEVQNIRFNTRGFANWTAGTFAVCIGSEDELTRSLIVLGAGAVRSTNASATEAAKDAFDVDIDCP